MNTLGVHLYRVSAAHQDLWLPTSPPTMEHLATCKSSICDQFFPHYWFSNFFFHKVSNFVDPRRGEILQGNSGQTWSWFYSSDWCSYHSCWFGVSEVLHFTHSRSWFFFCRSVNSDIRQECHVSPKDSVLEEGSQLHIRRLQLPHVDRSFCHNSKSPQIFLSKLLMNWSFTLIQLSYEPLGRSDPLPFNLGVAFLLVRWFCKSFYVRCIYSYIFFSCSLSPSRRLSMQS